MKRKKPEEQIEKELENAEEKIKRFKKSTS